MVEIQAVQRFFDNTLKYYNYNEPGIVGWSSQETQQIRFKVLCDIAPLDRMKILDVGCGVGDIYKYIINRFDGVEYTGIDCHKKMVHYARKKHPEGKFLHKELLKFSTDVDYILASGVFNLAGLDNMNYIEEMIQKMMRMANKGIAVNMLSSYSPPSLMYPDLYYYDPIKVLERCMNTFKKISMRHDYLPHDFTLYIYK